jgi:hypothetical protein
MDMEDALELVLRRINGDAFQSFFSDFMGRLHGDEFIPVRPHGRFGDGGNDGMFGLGGGLYQCYGALNGSLRDINAVKAKVQKDFATALAARPDLTDWSFTHNLVDGLPEPIVRVLEDLGRLNPSVRVRHYGVQSFRRDFRTMQDVDRQALAGRAAVLRYDAARLPTAVSLVISSIVGEIEATVVPLPTPALVSATKMDINKLSVYWRDQITSHLKFCPIVGEVLARHGDARAGYEVPGYFSREFADLEAQGFDGNQILGEIRAGILRRLPELEPGLAHSAATAVLAAMFEACVVLRDRVDAGDAVVA